MKRENFTEVLTDLRDMQEDREEAVREAQEEVEAAERNLAYCELSADMRTWTWEEREAWESAHYRVREAYDALRKAKAAL